MANFEKAYKRLGPNEGGYANHPNDRGGETWKGIARNFWPRWAGWVVVDGYKKESEFPKMLHHDQYLEELVQDFYKQNFWNTLNLDKLESQWVAENVFDAAVNCGTDTGAKFLQRAVNELDGGLVVDGKIGPLSLNAANSIDEETLVNEYVDIRLEYHRKIVERNPNQLVFYAGWKKRCEGMRKKVG